MHNARQSACAVIEERIVRGELSSGRRLDEGSLAGELDVDAGVVREALACLERDNLTRAEADGGFSVTPLDDNELRELYPVALLLEGLAVRTTADFPPEQLERLREINGRLASCANDPETAAMCDWEFHDELVGGCGNEQLLDTLRPLKRQLLRYEFAYMDEAATSSGPPGSTPRSSTRWPPASASARRRSSRPTSATPYPTCSPAWTPAPAPERARPAVRKRAPIRHMSAPVAATRSGAPGSSASCTSGKPKTPARAPHANERVVSADRGAEGDREHRGERRDREHPAGEGHDGLAAAEAGEQREGVAEHRRADGRVAAPHAAGGERRRGRPPCPSGRRPRRRARPGAARAAPARSRRRDCRRPSRRRSTPWRRATSRLTGMEPSR